ncbi:MAG: NADH-quinone oxidoreductase subunit J [Bacteroidota bacterium]
MTLYDILFYLFAVITIASAFVVVTTKNVIYSGFSLLLTFFGVAGIYVLLGADFLAIVQIMVYVGGILILILFGVMLTNKITDVDIRTGTIHLLPAAVGVGILFGALISVMVWTDWKSEPVELPVTTTYTIGRELLTNYVLIFVLLGLLLLVVLIGAASIARRDKE